MRTLTTYENGQREGAVARYYEDGSKALQGAIRGGDRHGRWEYWYPDGTPKETLNYRFGELQGERTAWFEDGSKRIEEHYQDGARCGVALEWAENGQILSERYFGEGLACGVHTFRHANGQLQSRWTYVDGKPADGEFRSYHEGGQLWETGTYEGGARQGVWTTYDASGGKVSEKPFQAGELHGTVREWGPDGAVRVTRYDHGRRIE